MGAVPSRESLGRGLCQIPDYGQKHKMVLIPLTREFFPSPDCLLLRQLFEARRDPFVHYYHTFDEGFAKAQAPDPAVDADAAKLYDLQGLVAPSTSASATAHLVEGKVWRADHFVPFSCTLEEFYDSYVCRMGERRIYDTDEQMLRLCTRDPNAIRPVPCAVAFAYNSAPTPSVLGNKEALGGEVMLREDGSNSELGNSGGESRAEVGDAKGSTLEESSMLFGLYVRVVGFVGGVSDIYPHGCNDVLLEDTFQLQVFLNKSVGDHNFVHAFITAVYTYVRQWREAAVMHIGSIEDQRQPTGRGSVEVGEGGHSKVSSTMSGEKPLMTPPAASVVIACKRTNVPMLCFQRGLRAMLSRLLGIVESEGTSNPGGSCCCRCGRKNDCILQTHKLAAGVPLGTPQDGDTKVVSECSSAPSLEKTTMLENVFDMWLNGDVVFACIPKQIVARALECVGMRMGCPECIMDIVRPKRTETRAGCNTEVRTAQSNPHVGVARDVCSLHSTADAFCPQDAVNALATTAAKGSSSKGYGGGLKVCDSEAAAAELPAHQKLHDVLGETVVVEEWPVDGIDLVSFTNAKGDTIDRPAHLYWVVGRSVTAQETAASAFFSWWAGGRLTVMGGGCDVSNESEHERSNSGKGKVDERLSVGELLYLNMNPCQSNAMHQWVLQRTTLPLEELLLSELHDSCKLARQAPVDAENWLRHTDISGPRERDRSLLLPLGAEDTNGEDLSEFVVGVRQLVGEGSLCLWRVTLVTGAVRAIAVTPHFLRPPRKKRARRKPTRRPYAPEQANAPSTAVDGAAPVNSFGPSAETQASKGRRATRSKMVTRRPVPLPTAVVSEGVLRSDERSAMSPSLSQGLCREGGVPPMAPPNTTPSVGFGRVRTRQQPCCYGNPALASHMEVPAFPQGQQSGFVAFSQPVVDSSHSPVSDASYANRRTSTPFLSRRTSREDQLGFMPYDSYNVSRRISSDVTSQRLSTASFTHFPRWDGCGTIWPYTGSEERPSVTRHSSAVGGGCTPFFQPADGWPNSMHSRSGTREDFHPSCAFHRTGGGFSSSGGCSSESVAGCARTQFDLVSASGLGTDEVYADGAEVRTPTLNVTVRRGLQH